MPKDLTFSLNKPNFSTFVVNRTKTKHFDVKLAGCLCQNNEQITVGWQKGWRWRSGKGVRYNKRKIINQHRCGRWKKMSSYHLLSSKENASILSLRNTFLLYLQNFPHVQGLLSFNKNQFLKLKMRWHVVHAKIVSKIFVEISFFFYCGVSFFEHVTYK